MKKLFLLISLLSLSTSFANCSLKIDYSAGGVIKSGKATFGSINNLTRKSEMDIVNSLHRKGYEYDPDQKPEYSIFLKGHTVKDLESNTKQNEYQIIFKQNDVELINNQFNGKVNYNFGRKLIKLTAIGLNVFNDASKIYDKRTISNQLASALDELIPECRD